ncbi:MAG: hypothetical protein M3Z75_03670 [Actinomycetota bacterium]|nr:hypothetical protein [Actinomycetota bacterium]
MPPSWHIVKSVHSGVNGDFTAMVATGKATGWAFTNAGAGSRVPRWNGHT